MGLGSMHHTLLALFPGSNELQRERNSARPLFIEARETFQRFAFRNSWTNSDAGIQAQPRDRGFMAVVAKRFAHERLAHLYSDSETPTPVCIGLGNREDRASRPVHPRIERLRVVRTDSRSRGAPLEEMRLTGDEPRVMVPV